MFMSKSAVANRVTGSETIVADRAGDEGTGLLYSMMGVMYYWEVSQCFDGLFGTTSQWLRWMDW